MKELDALDRQIVQDTRRALDQAATAARLSQFYVNKVLPQAQRNLELGNISYKAGKTSILLIMEAQRSLLATRRLAVTTQQSAAISLADLELVVGRPLSAITIYQVPTSQPATSAGDDSTTQPAQSEDAR